MKNGPSEPASASIAVGATSWAWFVSTSMTSS
jgi:hypothetical protein